MIRFLVSIMIIFVTYLIVSGVISVIGGFEYFYVLRHPAQLAGLLFVYWTPAMVYNIEQDEIANRRFE
jgi:hypothetical protein